MESLHIVSMVSEAPPLPPHPPTDRSGQTVPVEAPRDRERNREESRKRRRKKKKGDTDQEKGSRSPLGRKIDIRAEATNGGLRFNLKTQTPQVGINCPLASRAVLH